MKNETASDLTLDEINQRFATDEAARAYWESIHWPNGPVCPHCKNNNAKLIYSVTPNKSKKIREGLRLCAKCNKQFTATIGTIFEDSHIPLRKWLIAWYMVCSSKKGISSLQLQRNLGLGSYRTALFMTHRIRYALKEAEPAPKLSGTVEVDETYIGGKRKGTGRGSLEGKVPVVALVERGGRVRSQVIKRITSKTLKAAIFKNVTPSSEIHTDENRGYQAVRTHYDHHTVKHAMGEYKRHNQGRMITTGAVEGYFSLIKRGIVGTFHHISEQYLPLYLAEFDHRYNFRNITDGQRTVAGLKMSIGKRLTYRA